MHLRFNTDCTVARLAAEASRDRSDRPERPWRQRPRVAATSMPTPLGRAAADNGELAVDDPRRSRLEAAMRAAVVGDLDSVVHVLTADAAGWAPSGSFNSLAEAVGALDDQPEALAVDDFRFEGLWWCRPVAIAEWLAETSISGPLLLGGDVLVDRTGHRVAVAGASFALFEDDRVAAVHTYFDEASLIEQVLLG